MIVKAARVAANATRRQALGRDSGLKVASSLFRARTDGAIYRSEDVTLGRLHWMSDAVLGAQGAPYRSRRDRSFHRALQVADGMQPGEKAAKRAHGVYAP